MINILKYLTFTDEFTDSLRFYAEHDLCYFVPDVDYVHLIKPYAQEIMTNFLRQWITLIPVDINLDSFSILKYVNGLNEELANKIVRQREIEPFVNRNQLKGLEGMTEEIFDQCADFLYINPKTVKDSEKYRDLFNPLDCTNIHPKYYKYADRILVFMGIAKEDLGKDQTFYKCNEILMKEISMVSISKLLQIDITITKIILEAIIKPLNYDYRC